LERKLAGVTALDHFYFLFSFLFEIFTFPFGCYTSFDMASEDIEAWAAAEGVPTLAEPFIQKYLSGRDALVEQEKKQRSGRSTHES
jgi:hypothetical protein